MTLKKIRYIRNEYKRDEINILGFKTPRSERNIHSPTIKADHYRNDYISSLPVEKVVWEVDLDETLHFLTGSSGSTELLTKNVKCEIE